MKTTRTLVGRTVGALALTALLLGAIASAASAAPDRGDGPQTDEERTLQELCQLAYDTLEWAKANRQRPGDVWDRIADGAFWFLDNHCENVDYETNHPAPSLGPDGEATGPVIVSIEPMDNPIIWGVTGIEPMDNPVWPYGVVATRG